MAKFIFFMLVVWLIWMYFRRKAENKIRNEAQAPLERPAETIVSCAHCGLCLPAAESIQRDNTDFCCAAHADLGVTAKAVKAARHP